MKAIALNLTITAPSGTGDTITTSDGDELDCFVSGFMVLAMADLEPGETATLSVTPVAAEGKQP